MDKNELIKMAEKAATKAYAPYSNFHVGAALLLENGEVITGCNVENRSYGLTNCAERSAIFAAVSQGETAFKALAISTPDSDYPVSPCGACRQVISEFTKGDFPIFFQGGKGEMVETTTEDIFPFDALDELKK